MWGKILGFCFGFMFGKIFGAILGLYLGHLFDKSLKNNFDKAVVFQVYLMVMMSTSAKLYSFQAALQ